MKTKEAEKTLDYFLDEKAKEFGYDNIELVLLALSVDNSSPDRGTVKEIFTSAFESYHAHLCDKWMEELPTDEEINKTFHIYEEGKLNYHYPNGHKREGAKLMRDKIKNINKK